MDSEIKLMKYIVIAIILLSSMLFSHSGRTDSNGGHNNRSTGGYHYHNGGYSQQKYRDKTPKFQCGYKKYCSQMKSCNEVMFYFKQCNLYRLDGDKDGIPCEKLCR